ncbi:MAG: ABC transporter substrate-binding protein [Desulfomonile tiedjei]|uniref:ABC transporter substrate-binding protein n=1 Tax=Desulfomonile tiedjei TaxID=2358 RepID=A0A9D6UY22_9BACT|nr:ABC transporter substrate-binding protein [Desulfomonile tiedjei]
MRSIRFIVPCLIASVFCSAQTFAQEPIKIGFMYVFSGRLAHYGYGAKQGAELAMSEINKAGGVNGRRLVGVYEDTKLLPEVGVEVAQKLVNQDRVDVLMGIVSSGVASAVAPVADRLATPLIFTLAMTPDVTGKICNPYTFRVSQNGPQNMMGAAVLAAGMPVKKWITMGPDYLFGYQCWEYFQKFLRPKRADVSFASDAETKYAPVSTMDFSEYIDGLVRSKADGILISLYGGNLVDFVRQANNKKFFDGSRTILMNLAYSADVMFGLGLDMPKGVWLGGLYWFQANESATNKRFVEDYLNAYKVFPDYNAHGAYSGVKAYSEAVAKAGSTDKNKVIKALQGLVLDLPVGTVTIRSGDHQAVVDSVWGLTSEFDGKLRCRMLNPMKVFSGPEITPSLEDAGCKLRE